MKDTLNIDNQEFVNYVRGFSDNLLIEFGEFFPFAAKIDKLGVLTGVGYQSENDKPASQVVLDSLLERLEEELSENFIRSFCVAYDTNLTNDDFPNGIDCIVTLTRHQFENSTIEFSFPYKIPDNGEIEYYDSWCVEK